MLWALAVALVPLTSNARAAAATVPSITDYISRAGDQVVTVPDGTYSGGTVATAHPSTSGPYKGWLVLVAESPPGVVVDMSQKPLVLDLGSSRVLFVGFTFVNGTMSVRGDDIAFWYTEHTFPIEEWNRQFQAAGGNADALRSMTNAVPKAIWIGDQTQGHTVTCTQILGADIHDVGDDGVYVDKSQDASIVGTRIWNVQKKTYDPGYNPWIPSLNALIHNDSVQIPGAVQDFTMADSYAGQSITVGGDNANAADLQWHDMWIAHADGAGMVLYSQNGYRVQGAMSNIRGWSNGYSQQPYDPGWDQVRVDVVDGNQVAWPRSLDDARLSIATSGTILNQQAPSGVAMSGGRMTDQDQALDDSANPANVWRVAAPYNAWRSLFNTGATVPSQGTADPSSCELNWASLTVPMQTDTAPVGIANTTTTTTTPTTVATTTPTTVATTTTTLPVVRRPPALVPAQQPPAAVPEAPKGANALLPLSAGIVLVIGVGALLVRSRRRQQPE
jgi:hypothetical protein